MHSLADGEVHGGGADDAKGGALARARRVQRFLAEGVQQIPPCMLACLEPQQSPEHGRITHADELNSFRSIALCQLTASVQAAIIS